MPDVQEKRIPILSRLSPPAGAVRNRMRVGRGIGSGKGKPARPGPKGPKAPGTRKNPPVPGGQAPLPRAPGYTRGESRVVLGGPAPAGRGGLTMRIDLPSPELEEELVEEIEARVRDQDATRVLLVLYTDEEPGADLPRAGLAQAFREVFADLVVTDVLLVHRGRFWSYLCRNVACCPAEGTSVEASRDDEVISLIEAEQVLSGRVVLPTRAALSASLQGPQLLASSMAEQRCQEAAELISAAARRSGLTATAEGALARWKTALAEAVHGTMPGGLEAAWLAGGLDYV